MNWPVHNIGKTERVIIQRLVNDIESEFMENGYTQWPENLCWDTCTSLIGLLRGALGNHGFRWKIVDGWFDNNHIWEVAHTWIESSDGTIIDPTVGQFSGGSALGIFLKGDPRYVHQRN